MIKYVDFYRRFGVRKESALKAFSYPDTKAFELPRGSVYHALPMAATDKSVDPNDLMIASHQGDMYCVHVAELKTSEGTPTKLPINSMSIIRQLEKQNRRLRRVRQMSVVKNNQRALLIYNYALLQHLYRYRVNFLNPYQRWYNTNATMWETISEAASEGDHQHFVRIDIPLSIPSIAYLNKAANNITRDVLGIFNSPQLLQLLDLWKWAGGKECAMSRLDPSVRERVNLVFIDGNHIGVINLFKLAEWRGVSDKPLGNDEAEDEQFIRELEARYRRGINEGPAGDAGKADHKGGLSLFQRKLLFFMVRLAQLRSVNAAEVGEGAQTDEAAKKAEDEAQSSTSGGLIENLFDNDKEEEDQEELEDSDIDPVDVALQTTAPGERSAPQSMDSGPVDKPTETLFQEPTDDDLMNDSLFEISAPEIVDLDEDTSQSADINVLAAPEVGVLARAQQLADRGLLSVAEVRRFEKLAVKYKEIPNPYGEGTLEQLATITPEMLTIDKEKTKLADIPGIDDKSMLESSLMVFDSKYIKEVLHRDIAQAVLSLQRVGVAVTDYQVDRVVDAVNKYDIVTVKLVPVSGAPSTLRFTVPVLEADGSWTADGARYMLRKQRGDAPIHKVAPDRVALTSYDSKLFVKRSDKVVNDYDTWLQDRIIAAMQSGTGAVEAINYRSGGAKTPNEKLPRLYTGLGKRFTTIKTPNWLISFEWENLEVNYGKEVVAFLAKQRLVPFAKGGSTILAMDDAGAIYGLEGRKLSSFGDIGQLFDVDITRAPLEVVEMKVAGKPVPVGVALCYLLGMDRVLADIKCTPRRVPKGTRLQLERDEFAIRFFDESLVFSKQDRMASLLFSGFHQFARNIASYPVTEFDKQDVYLNAIEGRGLGMRQLNALTDHKLFFIDPITLGLLKEMGEPTDFVGLLYRSTELLLHDNVPEVDDRYKGYERIAAAVYREVSKAAKLYRRRPLTAKASVDMNPSAVWMAIQTDPAKAMIEDANPINYLKEQEAVTFGGTGGRSSRVMVRSTRRYNPRDFGVISEATKDSSDVAISTYFTANPQLNSLRGTIDQSSMEKFEMTTAISTSALCAPAALNDDQQ